MSSQIFPCGGREYRSKTIIQRGFRPLGIILFYVFNGHVQAYSEPELPHIRPDLDSSRYDTNVFCRATDRQTSEYIPNLSTIVFCTAKDRCKDMSTNSLMIKAHPVSLWKASIAVCTKKGQA